MIILITGASHTGKTLLAQKLLEKYHMPYLSIDHLKMGLIRSGYTDLTVEDDRKLEVLMWPIVREIIKTAIENQQNLIIEGAYIPFYWQDDFDPNYLDKIRFICLVMSEHYINSHFEQIKEYANVIEKRIDDSWCTKETVREENAYYLDLCKKYHFDPVLIEDEYKVDLDLNNWSEQK